MSKPLYYLDLELKHVKDKLTLDNYHYYCFAGEQGHKHIFHTVYPQLNLLCDNSYCVLNNLHAFKENSTGAFEKLLSLSIKISKKLVDLEDRLEYIKQQKQTKQPTSEELKNLQTITFQGIKKVEQETVLLIKNLDNKIQELESKVSTLIELVNNLL